MSNKKQELKLFFHPDEIYYPVSNKYKYIENVYPVFYNTNLDYTYNKKEYKCTVYKIYYMYNGGIGLGHQLFPRNEFLGFHEKDTETIAILYDNDIPKLVYFSAHRNEGKWVKFKDCNFTENNELCVYVAKNSHANYPSYGSWFRILFFANDHTSIRGKKIVPELFLDNTITTRGIGGNEKNRNFAKRIIMSKN